MANAILIRLPGLDILETAEGDLTLAHTSAPEDVRPLDKKRQRARHLDNEWNLEDIDLEMVK